MGERNEGFFCMKCNKGFTINMDELINASDNLKNKYDLSGKLSHIGGAKCPICGDIKTFKCDTELIPALEILWEKGYNTVECCCSHDHGDIFHREKCQAYIKLKPDRRLTNFWMNPKNTKMVEGFKFSMDRGYHVIEPDSKRYATPDEKAAAMIELAKNLYCN